MCHTPPQGGTSRHPSQATAFPLPAISSLILHVTGKTWDWVFPAVALELYLKIPWETVVVFWFNLFLRWKFISYISISFPSISNLNCISRIGNCNVWSGLNITLILITLQLRGKQASSSQTYDEPLSNCITTNVFWIIFLFLLDFQLCWQHVHIGLKSIHKTL